MRPFAQRLSPKPSSFANAISKDTERKVEPLPPPALASAQGSAPKRKHPASVHGTKGGPTSFSAGSEGEWNEMLQRLSRFVNLHGHVSAAWLCRAPCCVRVSHRTALLHRQGTSFTERGRRRQRRELWRRRLSGAGKVVHKATHSEQERTAHR